MAAGAASTCPIPETRRATTPAATPRCWESRDIAALLPVSVRASVRACRAVRVALQGPVRKRHRHELPAMGAVLKRVNNGRNLHAWSKGLGHPTLARKTTGRTHFDRPLVGADIHQDPAMRVGPLKFLHCTFQRDLLVRVEHCERMMRKCRCG